MLIQFTYRRNQGRIINDKKFTTVIISFSSHFYLQFKVSHNFFFLFLDYFHFKQKTFQLFTNHQLIKTEQIILQFIHYLIK